MNSITILSPQSWKDYELLDSGAGEKLERFGSYVVSRPDPRALWEKNEPSAWETADAKHRRTDNKSGEWDILHPMPDPWMLSYKELHFRLTATEFKHVGLFPEQAVNWDFITQKIAGKPIKVLNLFGSTGAATVAALSSGATVTHVDASKSAIDGAVLNASSNHLNDAPVRWILEDCMKFVEREIRRGATYNAVILDPPRFGRGTRGEIWKLETHLPILLQKTVQLLKDPLFVILNAYTADLSPIAIHNLMSDCTKHLSGNVETCELALKETKRNRYLPSGIVSRWINQK